MRRRQPIWATVLATLLGVGLAAPLAARPPVDDAFFADQLYPVLQAAECRMCHNDSGVASATGLQFPAVEANREQIIAFGLQLRDLIDIANPTDSWLLLKPTQREEHTGGLRIAPGSDEERMLIDWIEHLASFTPEQHRAADERIAAARKYELEPLSIRRLTHSQYNNTVRDLLGDLSRPATRFPKEDFINGFTNQLAGQSITPLQMEAYSEAAERLAQAAVRASRLGGNVPLELPATADRASVDEFVRRFGLRAFRRPLSDDEVTLYATLMLDEAQRGAEPAECARLVIEAMLQSPHFLYRIERGHESPYRQYEIASRLAYFLWDTMPDAELLRAAEAGELSTVADVEGMARRMLDDPRARPAFHEFLGQWMRFDRVLSATRDRRRFQGFNPEMATAMTEETRRLFDHVVWGDRSFMEFFTADYTFVNADLAELYGLPAPAEEFARVDYPADSGRAGVLGHGSFLLLTSKPTETSPTGRGLFVRNQLLGQEVPPPPADAVGELPEVTEARPLTNRQRLETHLGREACASCHRLIDPIGLGFEQYNAVGAFEEKMQLRFGNRREARTVELEVDTTAHIQGIEDSTFSSPKELGHILANSETCHRCVVKQLFRYAMGRSETANDRSVLDEMLADFRQSGFRFREVIISLVTSDLFLEGGSS